MILLPGLVRIRREICTDQALFTSQKQSKTALNKYVAGFWCEAAVDTLFLGGICFYKHSFCLHNVNWWTGVVWITCGLLWCFYHLFGLSFWRHPFTAEHPLLSKWCNDTFLQIYIMDGLRVNIFSANFHFWVNYSFKYLPLFQFI